jgi:hypothetical protein
VDQSILHVRPSSAYSEVSVKSCLSFPGIWPMHGNEKRHILDVPNHLHIDWDYKCRLSPVPAGELGRYHLGDRQAQAVMAHRRQI